MMDRPASLTTEHTLPRWLWLWFPPLMAIVVMTARLYAPPEFYDFYIDGENGLIELSTALLALAAAVLGIMTFRLSRGLVESPVRFWILLTALGCFYIGGEDLSWGQHLFGWKTPELIANLNDQGETNLHNMSSWFDQKPRLLLELWVIVGGIVLPLRRLLGRQAGFAPVSFAYWFWPTIECLPSAVLAVLIRLPDRYKDVFGVPSLSFDIRWSEPQEYYMVLFLFIYILSLRQRLIGLRAATAALVRAEH